MAASSSVVIKVNHEDTMRRFIAEVVGDELNLNAAGLRRKIIYLFSFGPDTELMLTYIDEDGDVVTLRDDDDLRDVVKQKLNPLRITVKLNSDENARYTRSSASSTPLRSPCVSSNLNTVIPEILHETMENLNRGVSDVLKTVSVPIDESIGTLSADLAYKAKIAADLLSRQSSTSGFMELLVDHFAKMGNFEKIKPDATVETSEVVKVNNVKGGNTEESFENIILAQRGNDSLSNSGREHPNSAVTSQVCGKKESLGERIILNTLKNKSPMAPVENNGGSSTPSSNVPSVNNFGAVKEATTPSEPKLAPEHANVGASDPTKGHYQDDRMTSALSDSFGKIADPFCSPGTGLNLTGLGPGTSPMYECPFSGLATGNGSISSPHPCWKSIRQNDRSAHIFHRGVRCDGCGLHPITGPRFKSKVKVDYDLCSVCFTEIGNNSDYMRMDRPMVYQQQSFTGLQDAQAGAKSMLQKQVPGRFKVKQFAQRMDSCFIRDVNIFDGTVMAPLTPFTKIWRMKNNGTVAWPQKVQIVWIGGDKLNNELFVDVQIPVNGLKIDEELEVAVDFISPELPGRYISYWRMALPSGVKFGQRIWVLIQVDASLNEPPRENLRNLNLNLPPPPVGSSFSGPEILNIKPEPTVVEDFMQPNTEQELKFPINDSLLVGDGASSSRPVSYPNIDLSDIAPAVSSVPQSTVYPVQTQTPCAPVPPVATADKTEDELPGKVDVEEKLLKELEEMGFKEVDLNKKMLRMNEYDLEQAVDDLCGMSEWDPILEELQEMGFNDKETNRMLLKKNNGSIKRVVMDLIAGEKM